MNQPDFGIPDLIFWQHPAGWNAIAAFANNYGISILPESDGKSYEVAIFRNGKICSNSGITEDVLRYISLDSVRDVAAVAANLPIAN